MAEIRAKLNADPSRPPGSVEFGGLYEQQQESVRNLLLVLGGAVLLVFTVLHGERRLGRRPNVPLEGWALGRAEMLDPP